MEHKQSFNHFLHKIKVHSRYFSTKECTIDFLSYVTKLIFNHFLRKPKIIFLRCNVFYTRGNKT